MKPIAIILTLLLHALPAVAADQYDFLSGSAEDNIEMARQIWAINRINDLNDQSQRDRLMTFLSSDKIPVARAAARKIAVTDYSSDLSLFENTNPNIYVKGTAGISIAIASGKTASESIKNAIDYRYKNQQMELIRPIFDDMHAIFMARGWGDKIPGKTKLVWEFLALREKTSRLSREDKLVYLIDNVINFKGDSYPEAATNILVDEFGSDAIPPLLKELEGNISALTKPLPPNAAILRSTYEYALDVFISIPDRRAMPILEELSQSSIPIVARKATDAIKWVKSGVPYPYKYRDLLIFNPPKGTPK